MRRIVVPRGARVVFYGDHGQYRFERGLPWHRRVPYKGNARRYGR